VSEINGILLAKMTMILDGALVGMGAENFVWVKNTAALGRLDVLDISRKVAAWETELNTQVLASF
jgi:hypothetical protein